MNGDVVVSAYCDEPEGRFLREIRFLELTYENLEMFWLKASRFPSVFGENVGKDKKKFYELFLSETPRGLTANGLFWVIDDFVGVYYITNITPGIDALAHYSFFDRRQKGREELTRKLLTYVFEEYGFERLSTEVPTYANKFTFNFVEDLGFKYEGRKRRCVRYRDKLVDKKLYGILRSELWEYNQKQSESPVLQDSEMTGFSSSKTDSTLEVLEQEMELTPEADLEESIPTSSREEPVSSVEV